MYTQCPDCATAFRVTAEVLRQAAGKVRCGGCSNAFNALDYLSEQAPPAEPPAASEQPSPELAPDPVEMASDVPRSISAEQSAALLKTLDQLAGSDIRIEDTGVEWRVLDEQEVNDNANDSLDDGDAESPPANDATPVSVDELRFDDNTPLPDDFGTHDITPTPPQPATDQETEMQSEPLGTAEPASADITLSEPEEWTDLLGEFSSEDRAEDDVAEEPVIEEPIIEEGPVEESPIEESPVEESPIEESRVDDSPAPLAAELDSLDVAEEPFALSDDEDTGYELTLSDAEDSGDESSIAAELDALEADAAAEPEAEVALELSLEDATPEEPVADIAEMPEEEAVLHRTIADELDALDARSAETAEQQAVAEMSEDEHTVNRMIDQELMALAIEDEDGFASTIVVPPETTPAPEAPKLADIAVTNITLDSGFETETIVMEGDIAHSDLDGGKPEPDNEAAAALAKLIQEGAEEPEPPRKSMRKRIIAGVVALLLLLSVQVVHQFRNALATIPAFNNAVGPVYRALGQPLQPAWDITGWRIQVTNGDANEVVANTDSNQEDAASSEKITIYSRIDNNSDKPLPYPLINVWLTDRFAETIGSRAVDPGDYLSAGVDPRKLVQPGRSFEAFISIESPTAAVTGFELDVCYRMANAQLRCKVDDFK